MFNERSAMTENEWKSKALYKLYQLLKYSGNKSTVPVSCCRETGRRNGISLVL